jgi:hypothetical protein
MTYKKKLTDMLLERGMFKDQAAQVMTAVIADPANEAMAGRWNDEVDAYPDVILKLAWINTRLHALAWIDTNAPGAWYRPMFE